MTRRILSAATLSGYLVRSREVEDLGCIEELMIAPNTGTIAYAVLSLNGFLGFGGKLLAIPWNLFSLDLEQRVFVLEADRATLESAPAFHEEQWPDFGDPQWAHTVHDHFGLSAFEATTVTRAA